MQVGETATTQELVESQLTITCKLAGPQHSEIGFPIYTDNASWRGPNIENFEKKFYKQCKLGKDNKFKIQGVILICYYYDNLQNYMKNK